MVVMLDLLTTQALAAFTLSLLGGAHCAGMCGGFVSALQVQRPRGVSAARLAAGYHTGRITSYVLAGVLVGTIGGALYAADLLPLQMILLVAGSLMLLAIGASLFGRASWLKRLEPLGLGVWRMDVPPTADKEIDTRGLNCPLPILRAKKALAEMTSGQVLKILATDPGSVRDFQAFARQTGNELLVQQTVGREFLHYLKRR